MNNNFKPNVVLLASKEFSDNDPEFKLKIVNIVSDYAAKAMMLLKIDTPLNIVIYPKASWSVPETGVGGYAATGDLIQIYIDTTNKDHSLDEIITERLPRTIYHECNHAARWRSCGFGTRLAETLVTEGLAAVFELQQWPSFVSPWLQVPTEEIKEMLKILHDEDVMSNSTYDHRKWFFGATQNVPRWFGYTVGHYIVNEAFKNMPDTDIVKLTNTPAEEILALSGVDVGLLIVKK